MGVPTTMAAMKAPNRNSLRAWCVKLLNERRKRTRRWSANDFNVVRAATETSQAFIAPPTRGTIAFAQGAVQVNHGRTTLAAREGPRFGAGASPDAAIHLAHHHDILDHFEREGCGGRRFGVAELASDPGRLGADGSGAWKRCSWGGDG